MDVSLMEVYFNDGELVMTTRYYPEDPMTTKVSVSGMEQVKGWINGCPVEQSGERNCIVRLEESGISCYTIEHKENR